MKTLTKLPFDVGEARSYGARTLVRVFRSLCWSGSWALPVYSEGTGGWEIVSGATGRYLVGFVVAAGVTGWLAERRWDRTFRSHFVELTPEGEFIRSR